MFDHINMRILFEITLSYTEGTIVKETKRGWDYLGVHTENIYFYTISTLQFFIE
jgi:hypothetical protein